MTDPVYNSDGTLKTRSRAVQVSGNGASENEALKRLEQNYLKRLVRDGRVPQSVLKSSTPAELLKTTADVLEEWLLYKKQIHQGGDGFISVNVRVRYTGLINKHITPHIGKIPVRLLSEEDIRKLLFTTLPALRKKVKQPSGGYQETKEPLLGASPLRTIQGILRMAMDYALKRRYILDDPNRAIPNIPKAPRKDEQLEKKKWVVRSFAEKLPPDELAYWILAFTGFRQSERLGLTWGSFSNLTSRDKTKLKTVAIKQQLERNGETGQLELKQETKTANGRRVLPLTERYVHLLLVHREQQKLWKSSPEWKPLPGLEDLVFTMPDGRPISHQRDNKRWRALLEKYNFPYLRAHSMRHIAVTMMVEAGIDMEMVGGIVGHGSEQITRSVYSHVSPKARIGAMESLEAAIFRNVDAAAAKKTAAASDTGS